VGLDKTDSRKALYRNFTALSRLRAALSVFPGAEREPGASFAASTPDRPSAR